MSKEREIIFRCVYSKEFKESFCYRLINENRIGSILGYSRNDAAVVYVLWDGRRSVDSLSIKFVYILDEAVESQSVNLDMKLATEDKLKLLQEQARKRHGTLPTIVIKAEKPKQTVKEKENSKRIAADLTAKLKECGIEFFKANNYTRNVERLKKDTSPNVKPQPEKKAAVKSMFDTPQKPKVDFRKINQHTGRAIYDPKSRVTDIPMVPIPEKENKPFKRPPAIYDNQKSLYGIDYNDL